VHGPETAHSAGQRRCCRCRNWLPVEAFGRDSRGYWRSRCRPCAAAASAEWQAQHRDVLLGRKRERYAAARAAGLSIKEAQAARERTPP
jgi:hypothetical protein